MGAPACWRALTSFSGGNVSRPSRAPRASWLGAITALGLTAATFAALGGTPAQATDWSACLSGPADRQAVFQRAAQRSGVPEPVLLGVSFMESRWDDHDGAPSTSAGYGPMHLTSPDGHRDGARASTRWARARAAVRRPPDLQATRERIGKDALSTLANGLEADRRQRAAAAA